MTVPSNVYRSKTAERTEEKYGQAETLVYFGGVAAPEVRARGENVFEVVASAAPGGTSPGHSLVVRLRGNEVLIADILAKANWKQVLDLLN
jgi:hypothetical protein